MYIVWPRKYPAGMIKCRRSYTVPIKRVNKKEVSCSMKELIKKISKTLKELLIGILFYGIIVEVIGICFIGDKVYFSIGLWFGVFLAMAAAIHMWWGLDKALDLDAENARKKMTAYSMFRYLAIIVVMAIVMITQIANPLVAVFGVFALKFGAYLQPLMHYLSKKIITKDNE